MRLILLLFTALAFVLPFGSAPAEARPKHLFKIASMAPEGSVWVTKFKEFAGEVKEKSGGEIDFKIYPGGIMGDDMAMYRKMRAGQLHGGGFTMTGISSVVPDFRVISIPFMFSSYQEVDAVVEALTPLWHKSFADKDLELIELTEVGFIYPMSTKPITTAAELRKATSWMPAGDPLAAAYLKNLGITPVQLAIPDVHASLQTGLVDTIYNSLYGAIVMQWFEKARYVTDTPFGYAYGVFLLNARQFNKLSDEQTEIIRSAAKRSFAELLVETRKSNDDSRNVLLQHGVEFVPADPASLAELEQYREKTIPDLVGSSFSSEIYHAMEQALKQYRAAHP